MREWQRGDAFVEELQERVEDWQAFPADYLRIVFNLEVAETDESYMQQLSARESWVFELLRDYDSYRNELSEISNSLIEEFIEVLLNKGITLETSRYLAVLSLSYFEAYCLKKAKPEMDFTVTQLRLAVDALTDRLVGVDLLNISALCTSLRLFQSFLYERDYQDKALFTQNSFQIEQFQAEIHSLLKSRVDEALPCFAYLESYPNFPWEEKEETLLDRIQSRSEQRTKNSRGKSKNLFRQIFGF